MARAMTAEDLFCDFAQMSTQERQRFFMMLSEKAVRDDDLSHGELFGHLAEDEFTSQDAAEYLEVSISTFRRLVSSGRLNPSSVVGRNKMFSVPELKSFKRALKTTKG